MDNTTPRPWRTAYAGSSIVSDDGLVGDLTASEQTTQIDEANGKLIVQAVNSHNALVSAVKFALKYHAMMAEKDNGKAFPAQLESSLRAALALAQGQQKESSHVPTMP